MIHASVIPPPLTKEVVIKNDHGPTLSHRYNSYENKSNRVRTIDAFSCVLVLLLVLIIVFLLVVLY